MAISDLPGYVQGFVFSDASTSTYESGVFKNQSPYGPGPGGIADITLTVGTPSFATANGQKGVILDNTVQGGFVPALPWDTACIMICRPDMSVNGTVFPVIAGRAVSVGSNGVLRLSRVSSTDYRPGFIGPSSTVPAVNTYAGAPALTVNAFELSQETRIGYSTKDGVTVTATAPVAASTNGVPLAWAAASGPDALGLRCRFGNLSGTIGDTSATTNTMELYELHFFRSGLLRDAGSLALLATEMAALKTKYGV
jgi:hypothetical protein